MTLALVVATRVVGTRDEIVGSHRFIVSLARPGVNNGEVILKGEFTTHDAPPEDPAADVGALLPLVVRFEARSFGRHALTVEIGNLRPEPLPIVVQTRAQAPT
jgi:hypothetical protein